MDAPLAERDEIRSSGRHTVRDRISSLPTQMVARPKSDDVYEEKHTVKRGPQPPPLQFFVGWNSCSAPAAFDRVRYGKTHKTSPAQMGQLHQEEDYADV